MPESRYWCELREKLKKIPIKADRIISDGSSSEDYLAVPNYQPSYFILQKLIEARRFLESMITGIMSLLYDQEILKKKQDLFLFFLLKDDLSRMLKRLDETESDIITDTTTMTENQQKNRALIYKRDMEIVIVMFFDSLDKSCDEFKSFKETKEIKKEPRTFFYILFEILSRSLSVYGATREKIKRVHAPASDWKNLLEEEGQEKIKKMYKAETGKDMNDLVFEDDLYGDIEGIEEGSGGEIEA